MPKLRNFPANSEALAKRCASELFCVEDFDVAGGRAGGGSGAFPVKVNGFVPPAWVKPAAAVGDNTRTAAHEKIVADIACALTFPVAPVMLSTLTKGKPVPLPDTVALSFGVLGQPKPWSGITAIMSDNHKASLSPQMSAMFALHCWIDDHDHNWNEGNALFECYADGSAAVVFYDYGHSLTHQWTPPGAAPNRNWQQRQGPWSVTKMPEIIHAVELIEKLAINDLEAIIRRIPPNCLAPDLGNHLITALDQRRAQLRGLMNLTGAP
jgi:hypothetical protein